MKKLIFFFLSINFVPVFSQVDLKNDKEKGIVRLTATIPILSVGAQYEHNIKGALTIVPKFSFTVISFLKSSNSGVTGGNTQAQYGILGSTELRYFYSLKRRESKGKVTRNFSGWYIGLEPFFLSNSIAASNTTVAEKNGSKGVFVNLGFQKQSGKHLYGGFFTGFAPYISNLSKIEPLEPYSNKRTPFWIGLSLGYVL